MEKQFWFLYNKHINKNNEIYNSKKIPKAGICRYFIKKTEKNHQTVEVNEV